MLCVIVLYHHKHHLHLELYCISFHNIIISIAGLFSGDFLKLYEYNKQPQNGKQEWDLGLSLLWALLKYLQEFTSYDVLLLFYFFLIIDPSKCVFTQLWQFLKRHNVLTNLYLQAAPEACLPSCPYPQTIQFLGKSIFSSLCQNMSS